MNTVGTAPAAGSWRHTFLVAVMVAMTGLILTLPGTVRAQAAQEAFPTTQADCPEDVAQGIARQSADLQGRLMTAYEDLADVWLEDQGGMFDAISVCVGNFNWRLSIAFQLPTLDAIIEAIIQQLLREVCNAARDAFRSVDSIFGGDGYYLNSPIPGMGRIGGSAGIGSHGEMVNQPMPSVQSLRPGVNGDPNSFYVDVPTEAEWRKILPPSQAPDVSFIPEVTEN